jgi:hypothetical protein
MYVTTLADAKHAYGTDIVPDKAKGHDPLEVANILKKESNHPKSVLLAGKITSKLVCLDLDNLPEDFQVRGKGHTVCGSGGVGGRGEETGGTKFGDGTSGTECRKHSFQQSQDKLASLELTLAGIQEAHLIHESQDSQLI